MVEKGRGSLIAEAPIVEYERKNLSEAILCRVDDQDVVVTIVWMTPEWASDLLANHNPSNRPKSKETISRVVYDLEAGCFRFNGATICTSTQGILLDGQNRLQAIVNSGIGAPVLLVECLDPAVMDTIDQLKARTVPDILRTWDVSAPNIGVSIAAMSILLQISPALYPESKDKKRVAAHVRKNLDVLTPMSTWAKKMSGLAPRVTLKKFNNRYSLSPSPLTALVLVMEAKGASREHVMDFFEKIATGVVSDNTEKTSIAVIRRWLSNTSPLTREGGQQLPHTLAVYATLMHVYMRYRRGEDIRSVRLLTGTYRWIKDLPKITEPAEPESET